MSPPTTGSLFDDYPDETRDMDEEMDQTFGMHEVTLLEQAEQAPQHYDTPTCDMTPEDVEALQVQYPGGTANRKYTNAYDRPWDFNMDRDTFIISGPTTEFARERGVRGRMFSNKDDAKAWVTATYGQVLETIFIPHKWAYRVLKPTARGGRYTPPETGGGR